MRIAERVENGESSSSLVLRLEHWVGQQVCEKVDLCRLTFNIKSPKINIICIKFIEKLNLRKCYTKSSKFHSARWRVDFNIGAEGALARQNFNWARKAHWRVHFNIGAYGALARQIMLLARVGAYGASWRVWRVWRVGASFSRLLFGKLRHYRPFLGDFLKIYFLCN